MAKIECPNHRHPHRHPEFVSGSIVPHGPPYRFQSEPNREINPMRIIGIDKIDFPLPMPILQLLFTGNGCRHIGEQFVMDKAIDGICRSMPRRQIIAVLIHALGQIRRHADIRRSIQLVCEDIGAGLFFLERHGQRFTAKWTLKQVQGDGLIGIRNAQLTKDEFVGPVR